MRNSSLSVLLAGAALLVPTAMSAQGLTPTQLSLLNGAVQSAAGNASATTTSTAGSFGSPPFSGGTTARTLAARAADIYNVRDFGALGTNLPVTLEAAFPATATDSLSDFAAQSVNGSTPYAWMTNPAFGLTFKMQTSAAQSAAGSSLTFLESLSGINNWTATVATWQDPQNGNFLVQNGMLVSGPCFAAGTTVTAVNRSAGAAGYGTVTTSAPSTTACPPGTLINFTIAPAQLRALTIDWLGIQGAMAAAWLNSRSGGSIYMPAGNYMLNHSLINAGGVTDSTIETPNLDIHGDGVAVTRLQFIGDLGPDMCGLIEATRGTGSTSMSTYHNFRMMGPWPSTRIEGLAPNQMDGLCLGAAAKASEIYVNGMRAGVNGVKDHWSLRDVVLSNNGYGIYFAPYSSTIGNQSIEDSSLVGNTIASIAVSTTNQIDSSILSNLHTGFSPYGLYYESNTSNTIRQLNFLSNSTLINIYIEAVGNGWIYGSEATGSAVNNTFIGGSYSDVGKWTEYALSNGSGGVISAPAVIYLNSFDNNTMVNTTWSDYGNVTDAIVESSSDCAGNLWINDRTFVFNANGVVQPLKCANSESGNKFLTAEASGMFQYVTAAVTAGVPLSDNGVSHVSRYVDGQTFAGIAATPAAANAVVGVISSGGDLQSVPKAYPGQAIKLGQPIFVTSGGVAGGIDATGAIGTAWWGSPSGTKTIQLDLDSGMKGGAAGAEINLSATGTSQATAFPLNSRTDEFNNVPLASGVSLAVIPIGSAIVIYNDAANALTVYPQAGGQIGSAPVNAGVSIPPGSSGTFRRTSTTTWHQ